MKKFLIILGHPIEGSFCHALAETFYKAAIEQGLDIEILDLVKLRFDPVLRAHSLEEQPLEEDLLLAQNKIKAADHLVFVYPNWWGNPPALLKGFIDRVFLPDFAFKYGNAPFPDKLLTGKTSELIITMDTPAWFYSFFMLAPGLKVMVRDVLGFCGIKNIRRTLIGPIRGSDEKQMQKYLAKVSALVSKVGK